MLHTIPIGAPRGCHTNVPRPRGWHKTAGAAALAVALCWWPCGAAAQYDPPQRGVSLAQVASVVTGTALSFAPAMLHLPAGPSNCVPCDRADVPVFDRWIIRPPIPAVARVSDVTLAGLALVTWADLLRHEAGERGVAASLESVAWASAATAALKAFVHRPRPVLYTPEAAEAAADRDNRLSMPSGHASMAFALGTSYLLSRANPPPVLRVAIPVLAVGVAAMRVGAARHFPSDVVAGAAVGVASAWVVHTVRF